MAAIDPSRLIGDIALHGGLLECRCQACGHIGKMDPTRLPPRYHAMAIGSVRFRCIRCGARGKVSLSRRRSPRNQVPPPNPQRVRDLYGIGCYLGALCTGCRPTRRVAFTVEEIERQVGASDPLVREAARILVCPHCRAPLLTSVGSVSASRVGAGRAW
jgi:hypothetical protein